MITTDDRFVQIFEENVEKYLFFMIINASL